MAFATRPLTVGVEVGGIDATGTRLMQRVSIKGDYGLGRRLGDE